MWVVATVKDRERERESEAYARDEAQTMGPGMIGFRKFDDATDPIESKVCQNRSGTLVKARHQVFFT